MAPVKATRKRKSDQSTSSIEDQKIPTMTSSPQRSPIKKRRIGGITLAQKQALIDNLQLEITERARRLRAQYHVQAQQIRSRVEMRINRIPTALRKAKMGELLSKSLQPQQPPQPPKPAATEEISGVDKENQGDVVDNPKKRPRVVPVKLPASSQQTHVLSPTSSNTRIVPRDRPTSPSKTFVSRPASPAKGPPKASSNMLSSMVEKAKGARPGTAASVRKPAAASSTSSNSSTAAARARQAAAAARPPTAASTRGRRKQSATSESSEGSTSTVVKKTTASRVAKTAAPAKRTVMGTIKSAATKKPPASKAAAPATGTGRTLRKRA